MTDLFIIFLVKQTVSIIVQPFVLIYFLIHLDCDWSTGILYGTAYGQYRIDLFVIGQFYFQESASLADRLIQYQVTRAQEAEEMFIVKNELASTKQLLRDNDAKLQNAREQIENFDEMVCTCKD